MGAAAPRCSRAGPAVAGWVGLIVAATAALVMLGKGPVSSPPLDPSQWLAWVQGRSPLVATAAILRLMALAGSWYLVAASAAAVAAGLTRSVRATRFVEAITLPALRPLLQAVLGASLASTVVLGATPAAASPPPSRPGSVTSQAPLAPASDDPNLAAAPPSVQESPSARSRRHLGPVFGRLDGAPARSAQPREPAIPPVRDGDLVPAVGTSSALDKGEKPDGLATGRPSTDIGVPHGAGGGTMRSPAVGHARPGSAPGDLHVVQAGESLWSIAHDVVARSLPRAPTDSDVAVYWRTLVDAHRPFLVNPEDPDLIFPGEVVRLPPSALPVEQRHRDASNGEEERR
jgi:hypothetical protein